MVCGFVHVIISYMHLPPSNTSVYQYTTILRSNYIPPYRVEALSALNHEQATFIVERSDKLYFEVPGYIPAVLEHYAVRFQTSTAGEARHQKHNNSRKTSDN